MPRVALTEAPRNWQLFDETVITCRASVSNARCRSLLAGKAPKQTVLVAIIDNGIDTTHADLRANLWVNPKEIGGNGKDDDNNGFADDVHGWNFIGGRDGQDVHWDTFEVTREYARCHNRAAASGIPPITDAARCKQVEADYDKQRKELEDNVRNYQQAHDIYQQILPVFATAAHVSADSLTPDRVRAVSAGESDARPGAPDLSRPLRTGRDARR